MTRSDRLQGEFEAFWSGERLELANLHLGTDQAPRIVFGEGVIDLQQETVEGLITWQFLRWPMFAADPEFTSEGGRIELSGTLDAWRLEGSTTVNSLLEEFPASANLGISANGQFEPLQFELSLDALEGSVRDKPVSGSGFVRHQDDEWDIDRFELSSGDSRLSMAGNPSSQQGLALRLEQFDLSLLLPGLQGMVSGATSVSLAPDIPRVRADL